MEDGESSFRIDCNKRRDVLGCKSLSELIFGATAATGGRVKFLNNCINLSENYANCFTKVYIVCESCANFTQSV